MLIRRSIQSKARIGAFSIISVLIISYYNGVNAMTLDRLSPNYNDIRENDKSQYLQHNKIGGQSVVYDNIEYLPVKQNDKSDMYVLATSDKNDDNFSSDIKDVTVKQDDMLMLESHDNPLIEMLQLPATTRNNGSQSSMEENEMIHQINEPPAIHYNSEQLSETSAEMVTEVIKKMQQEMKSENEKKSPLASEELYDSQTLENEKNTQTEESLDIPMIGVVQEEEIPHESQKEQDTPFKESEMNHENNENESYSLLDNQSQENLSKPAEWQEVQQIMDKVKEDISNIEDYASNEEELPEECGDEYYMNPNQDPNAKDSTSQEFASKPDMELQSVPSHNENEMFEETQNQQKPEEDITNLDNGLSGESENIMDLPSAETQSTAFADNHNIHNIYEPLEPIIMSAQPFDISQEEQGTNKPLQLETKINAINGLAEKENNTLLTTIIEMPQTSITENPAIVTTSEETFNQEDFKEILATTMNPNFEIITTSQQEQQQQQQPILIEKDIVKEGEIETVYNSQLRRYDGAQVWRIVVQNDKERRLADELHIKYGGQLWKEIKQEVDYLLKPQVLVEAEQYVRAANLSRIVLIDNLQKVIEVENPPAEQIVQLQNRKGHRLTWQAYHRLEDIHGFFDYLAKTYPDICSVEIIGYSIEKRPLKILKISNGQANNTGIWIDGGIHAREWISPAVVTYVANHLVEGWDDLPPYMRNINWYIHAVVNPDGYEYSHTTDRLWRKNMRSHGRLCPGVDLNRNFGYMWGGRGTSANPCSQIYRGTKAFSEPEAFYISKFISGFPKETFKAYLSFHSYGQYILYPWGYDYLETNDTMDLDLLARQAGTSIAKSTGVKYTVGPAANTLYPAAGSSDDWAKGIAEIKYSYTIEMGDTGRYGFVLPASQIECNGKDAYTVVETISRGITMGKNGRRRKLKLRRS